MKGILIAAGTLLLIVGSGAPAKAGWSSSSSWSGSGSSSSQNPTCVAANLTLSLATADCHKCHTGDDTAIAAQHHSLIGKPPKNLQCLGCHQPVTDDSGGVSFPVERVCISCHVPTTTNLTGNPHGPNVHDKVTHCVVYDACGNCHKGSLPDIHANASTSGNNYSYHGGTYGSNSKNPGVSACYLCHASTNPTVQQTVIKGLSGQTVACSNCHGR